MRDIARSKIRTIMGTVGVLGCMIASLGLHNTLDYAMDMFIISNIFMEQKQFSKRI